MKGFTVKGDDSEYVNTLPALWKAADVTFSDLDMHFYEYGEASTNEFKGAEALSSVRQEVLRSAFYGGTPRAGGIRTLVKSNGGQPFTAVTDYIKTLDEAQSAFVIITDLYEQNRDDPFSRFYRDAFSRGLSAAFFAVEASFSGSIYSVSRVAVQDTSVQVRDGKSTFYICIAGNGGVVSAYCAALTKELNANKIVFENAVFMVESGGKLNLFHQPSVMAGNARGFGLPEYAYSMVNLRSEEVRLIGESSPYTPFEAYQLLTKTGSRWTVGVPLANINTASFNYSSDFSLSRYDGRGGSPDEPSRFNGISNSPDVTMRLSLVSEEVESSPQPPADTAISLYLVAETKNRSLDKGWYKIQYHIVPNAMVLPAWVSELNAENIPALEESARERGARVKTLQLANVYEKIAEAYNGIRAKSIYSDELYFVKR
jgi:hypothetical protein